MKKLKLGILYTILIINVFSVIKTAFAEEIKIDIPESYISNINDGNKSIVRLNDKGTDGLGIFFLGDTINAENTQLTITPNGSTYSIVCNKQLKGYYTNNFLNFKMFPLDSQTPGSNGINFNEGGLYYGCSDGDTVYTGIYGYIKWTYKSGDDSVINTHEIRAGLVGEENDLRWDIESPLQTITQGNYRALSGHFRDYLAKRATVLADFNEGIFIDYPDEYFINTKAFSGNRNETYFNDSGNYGFGLFFLGTGIENGPYEITDNNGTILSCSGQLDGYYSFSFNDFGMLPLDQATKNYENQYNTEYNIDVDGGLYYNCRQKNTNTIYTGVYGYLKRNYNYGNVHEIRAGIKSDGSFYNQSPIEVIYSDNFRNVNRTLSGQFHDNLSKNSITLARFFGDLGIIIGDNTEIKASGTLDDPYFVIPFESYSNAKLYVKSSQEDTKADITLTEFDSNGQNEHTYDQLNLDNIRSLFGFYGYKDNIDFSNNPNLKSGAITVKLTNSGNKTRTKTIRFEIANPVITIPEIKINHNPECSTGIQITASVTVANYQTFDGYIGYIITGSDECNENTTNNWNDYTLGQIITINETGHNGDYICFMASNSAGQGFSRWQITGIDLDGPEFIVRNRTGQECSTGKIHIERIEEIGCSEGNKWPISWNGINRGNDSYFEAFSGGIGSLTITGYVQDQFGNNTSHTGTFTWNDTLPTISQGTITYTGIVTGTTILFENLITSMEVEDGDCGNSTISKTGDITCTPGGAGSWTAENGISVIPPVNDAGEIECTVWFTDDEGSTVSGKVIYRFDTQAPIITIYTQPDPLNTCSRTKLISGSINESGSGWINIGDNISTVCNNVTQPYTRGTNQTFNTENDNGKYICFKASDLYGNISSVASEIITNIDRTPPTFDLITGEVFECDTGTISIINVQQIGCAQPHDLPYKRNDNTRTGNNTHNIYSATMGTQHVKIKVQDAIGNISSEIIEEITRKDHQITGQTEINIGDISEDWQFNPVSLFELTGRGLCEQINIIDFGCDDNATLRLTDDHNTGTITPKPNTDHTSQCTITFTDRDTTITGTIHFTVKTKEYFIVLDQEKATETGEIKDSIDTGKVSAALYIGNQLQNLGNDVIRINEFRNRNPGTISPNGRPRSAEFDIDLNINIKEVDKTFHDKNNENIYPCSCDTGIFRITFDDGFITDPAGNPSANTPIDTNNIYVAGNYLYIEGGDDAKSSNTNLSTNGFILTGYSRNALEIGTGSIICTGNNTTCPNFSCDTRGIISISNNDEYAPYGPFNVNLFGNTYQAPFYYKFALKIDPITNFGGRTFWSGCEIRIVNNSQCSEPEMCKYSFTTINIDLVKRPIKAGDFGSENYRESSLGDAINAGSGDDGFLFFITHPQNLKSGGVLGNIKYTINFSEDVADEFYYITGSAIVNGYKEDLNIKRPTFNYRNPRSYLFNFPEN